MINFGTVTFHLGPPNMSSYVAAKGGITGLTRSLSRELGPQKIRANTISPGWIMTERQLQDHVTEEIKELLYQQQCISDLLQLQEIAEVAF